MKQASGPTGKSFFLRKRSWQYSLAAGMLLCLLVVLFWPAAVSSPRAFAASHLPATGGFITSPAEGPVGAVIAVTGSNLTYSDGTQIPDGARINPGYVQGNDCVVPAQIQSGTVSNHAFRGWLRWPIGVGVVGEASGVCVVVINGTSVRSFQVGTYTVLSASAPQITVAPAKPSAGKQATVTGANFLPGGVAVSLVWQSVSSGQTVSLGSATSDNTGAFTQTFTVPSNSSTGSYSLTASSGISQPPTLSASTTFQVNGITIVPVSTPGAHASPTPAASASPTAVAKNTPITRSMPMENGGNTTGTTGQSSLLLPIILAGGLLVVLALIAGALLVRRQRSLAALASSAATTAVASGAFGATATLATRPDEMLVRRTMNNAYMAGGSPLSPVPGSPVMDRLPGPGPAVVITRGAEQDGGTTTIPFDADLAEAMRQAQVSLFAMPRPPEEALP